MHLLLQEDDRRRALRNVAFDPLAAYPPLAADDFSHEERRRCREDFAYWCARHVIIKNKKGGLDVPFILNAPQRKFVALLESQRTSGQPIRIVLLKARQWGGSTTAQIYMAWLQLVHKPGLNSLIIAQQHTATSTIKDMFDRMIGYYPVELLHEPGDKFKDDEVKIKGVGRTGSIFRIPQRNAKITLGTAERPDACRGGDYNLVHLSEVGLWKATPGKTPEDIVRSACSGVLLEPYTMIVLESTANGTGTFFQQEYDAAKTPELQSQFAPLFIAWHDIEQYRLPFPSEEARRAFAADLLAGRDAADPRSSREAPGKYLWGLWERGVDLEALHWYVRERAKYSDQAQMASEYPSDDVEAFTHSGNRVFDAEQVYRLRDSCRLPGEAGDVIGLDIRGKGALQQLHFAPASRGSFRAWAQPDPVKYRFRYLTVVDIGGRSANSDWSVIVVFDREPMCRGLGPTVVAQWYGHNDVDLVAWKAAQIAAFYDNALLVIESNTLETHDYGRNNEGDQSGYVLSQIRDVYFNLYARGGSQEDICMTQPTKFGFHTNVSTKAIIISNLIATVRDGGYTERDPRCLDEYLTYERRGNGSWGAIPGKHDDLLMTRAIGLHISAHEMPLPVKVPASPRSHSPRPLSECSF